MDSQVIWTLLLELNFNYENEDGFLIRHLNNIVLHSYLIRKVSNSRYARFSRRKCTISLIGFPIRDFL
jgi:hypothetical protein